MAQAERSTKVDAAAAIDQVLAAEQSVREAMEACRSEARAVLETAREQARRVTRRATARISRLHARCDELCRARVRALRQDALKGAPRPELNDDDRQELARAAERMAARLTCPDDG
jgi:vacuolar-type H+-ATPase subunit H